MKQAGEDCNTRAPRRVERKETDAGRAAGAGGKDSVLN
jgi:hypothetical protein